MTQFRDGGVSLGASQRPVRRSLVFFVFVLVALMLSACAGELANESFAGMSTDGEHVFLAHGTGVLSFDVASQSAMWTFPPEPSGAVQFFAAPNQYQDQVVFGDFGAAGGFLNPRVTVSIYSLPGMASGVVQPQWTNTESATDKIVAPALQVGDIVYVGTADNHMLALNRATGEELWDFEMGHAVWGQPAFDDDVLYVTNMDWSVYALNAQSGELLWQAELGGALPSRPVVDNNIVYVSSFDRSVYALNQANGEILWQAPVEGAVWGAPTVDDDVVYFGDVLGNIYKVDAASGMPIWSVASDVVIQASPVLVGESLFVASEVETDDEPTGALTAYSAVDGTQLWRTPTLAPLYTTPVVVNGDTIVVAQQNADSLLVGFDTATGTERWRYALPSSS